MAWGCLLPGHPSGPQSPGKSLSRDCVCEPRCSVLFLRRYACCRAQVDPRRAKGAGGGCGGAPRLVRRADGGRYGGQRDRHDAVPRAAGQTSPFRPPHSPRGAPAPRPPARLTSSVARSARSMFCVGCTVARRVLFQCSVLPASFSTRARARVRQAVSPAEPEQPHAEQQGKALIIETELGKEEASVR